jgi:hypothetical protein
LRQGRERCVDAGDAARNIAGLAEVGNQTGDLGGRIIGHGTTDLSVYTDEILDLAHTHPPSLVEQSVHITPIAAGRGSDHAGHRCPVRPFASVVLTSVGSTYGPGEWYAGYADRVTALVEEAGQVNARLVSQWGARSLQDTEWTVDTLTADLIEAWDHLTPLAERGLELWLELIQQAIRPGDHM